MARSRVPLPSLSHRRFAFLASCTTVGVHMLRVKLGKLGVIEAWKAFLYSKLKYKSHKLLKFVGKKRKPIPVPVVVTTSTTRQDGR